MELKFQTLNYDVTSNEFIVGTHKSNRTKTILKNITGKFLAGELCGILGQSGSGKTTLLHTLSAYRTKGVYGKIMINGVERDQIWRRQISCYIMQEDNLPSFISVQELMMLVANLKLPTSVGQINKKSIVQDILLQLGLDEVLSTSIENLSGGERKRMSIALELIDNPPVLFLDEPTSCVDNVTAKQILQLLQKLTTEGRTIIITIHQPSTSLLCFFDRVYFLADGQCIYQGIPNGLVPFLNQSEFMCPSSYNPADFLIELSDNTGNIATLSNAIENGKLTIDKQHIEQLQTTGMSNEKLLLLPKATKKISKEFKWKEFNHVSADGKHIYRVSRLYQFWILFLRYFRLTINNKLILLLQFIHTVACSTAIGIIYYDSGNDATAVQELLKCFISMSLFFLFTRIVMLVLYVPLELKLTRKEYFNKWYQLEPYYLAKWFADLPVQCFFNCMYVSIAYYMLGLPKTWSSYFIFLVAGNLTAFISDGIGYIIGTLFNPTNGMVIGPVIILSSIVFGIYGLEFAKNVSPIMNLIKISTPVYCHLSSMLIATYGLGREKINCDSDNLFYCQFVTPQIFLKYIGVNENELYRNFYILIFSFILLRIISYCLLRIRFS